MIEEELNKIDINKTKDDLDELYEGGEEEKVALKTKSVTTNAKTKSGQDVFVSTLKINMGEDNDENDF